MRLTVGKPDENGKSLVMVTCRLPNAGNAALVFWTHEVPDVKIHEAVKVRHLSEEEWDREDETDAGGAGD